MAHPSRAKCVSGIQTLDNVGLQALQGDLTYNYRGYNQGLIFDGENFYDQGILNWNDVIKKISEEGQFQCAYDYGSGRLVIIDAQMAGHSTDGEFLDFTGSLASVFHLTAASGAVITQGENDISPWGATLNGAISEDFIDISVLNQITDGDFHITINGNTVGVSNLDLSSITNVNQVCNFINPFLNVETGTQLAILAFNNYSPEFYAYSITNLSTGNSSTLSFASGTIADALKLTESTSAVLTQGGPGGGTVAINVATTMANLVAKTTDFVVILTAWTAETQEMEDIATWVSGQKRYIYACADSDSVPATSASPTTCMGSYLITNSLNNTALVRDMDEAAFVAGCVAATNYAQKNGRITLAFKAQPGLTPSVTDATSASNLLSNGYNFFGAYATAAQPFDIFYNGQISGAAKWIDSAAGAIWLNKGLELAIASLFAAVTAIPYNQRGYAMIKAACLDPINAALNTGVIVPGVTLSSAQIIEINTAAGLPIDKVLTNKGYYLQILDASPAVRSARTSPTCTLWYTDGGAIQKLTLTSIDVQ